MKKFYITCPLLLALLLSLAGCANTNSSENLGPLTRSESPEDFLQNEEIVVAARAAVQFAVMELHKENPNAATQKAELLNSILPKASTGKLASAATITAEVKKSLNKKQATALSAEFDTAEQYIAAKLANNTIANVDELFSAQEYLTWIHAAAIKSAEGYNTDIICPHGIALGDHEHNSTDGIRINLF